MLAATAHEGVVESIFITFHNCGTLLDLGVIFEKKNYHIFEEYSLELFVFANVSKTAFPTKHVLENLFVFLGFGTLKCLPLSNDIRFCIFFANVSRSAFSTSTTLGPYRFSFSNSLRFTRYDFAVSQLYTMFDDFCLSQKGESHSAYPDDPPHRAQVLVPKRGRPYTLISL